MEYIDPKKDYVLSEDGSKIVEAFGVKIRVSNPNHRYLTLRYLDEREEFPHAYIFTDIELHPVSIAGKRKVLMWAGPFEISSYFGQFKALSSAYYETFRSLMKLIRLTNPELNGKWFLVSRENEMFDENSYR